MAQELSDLYRALFDGQIEGVVVATYANERPLAGAAGKLDWFLRGALTAAIRRGALTGKAGECVYIPYSHQGRVLHVLTVGGGYSDEPGERKKIPSESMELLKKNILGLKLEKIGVSRSDLVGDLGRGESRESLWIAP